MIQLSFDETFENIIEKPINYWRNTDDIPEKIKRFISKTSDLQILFEEKTTKYYCSKCLKELDKNNICPKCSKNFINNDKYKLKIFDIKDIKNYKCNTSYYVFDVIDDNIILYIINEHISYNNPLTLYPVKISNIIISKIYQIFSDKITEIRDNKTYTYDNLEKVLKDMDDWYDTNELFDTFEEFETISNDNNYIYVDNFDELEKTNFYRYSNISKVKEYLQNNYFNLTTLTYIPICCKQFEYLVNMELYNLACNSSFLINYDKSFYKTFGVDKKYYPFMTEIDISYQELLALRLCQTTDIHILNFIKNNLSTCEYLKNYVKLDDLRNYLLEQNVKEYNIHEYYDYIRCCEKLKLNLKDKNILYPKNFIDEHDKITYQVIVINNPETDEKISNLAVLLNLNKYEDDKYVIFPAKDINSLIDESREQSNCVRTYSEFVANNECQIYFMRYKNDISKSLVTIEVKDNKVVQARTRFNKEPSDEIMNVIKKWEKDLIKINNR